MTMSPTSSGDRVGWSMAANEMSHRFRISHLLATAGVVVSVAAASPAQAGQITIDGRQTGATYVFKVKTVKAPSVRSARLLVNGRIRRPSLARVRRGIRRGTVTLPAGTATNASRTRETVRPRLRLTTSGASVRASRSSRPAPPPPPPAPPPAPASPPAGGLAWSPPALSSPITLTLSTGSNYFRLDNQRDYIVKYPSSTKIGQLMIEGGRNITIIGGRQRNYYQGFFIRPAEGLIKKVDRTSRQSHQ